MKGLSRDRRKMVITPTKCRRCGLSGGTMVKIGDHYEHQDKDKCRLMQSRRSS